MDVMGRYRWIYMERWRHMDIDVYGVDGYTWI